MNHHRPHLSSFFVSFVMVIVPAAASGQNTHGHGSTDTSHELILDDHTAQQDLVEVGVDGTRYDPAVSVEQIPAGAWICDMGTVHYASLNQGDGSCPVCGMFLTQTETGLVELDESGSQFDPPIEANQVPPDAWFCDMGTVHYASMNEGDGSCPVCGMSLTQQSSSAPSDEPDGHTHSH